MLSTLFIEVLSIIVIVVSNFQPEHSNIPVMFGSGACSVFSKCMCVCVCRMTPDVLVVGWSWD